MGSTTVPNSTRKEIIDEVFQGWNHETPAGIKVETRCIAKQFKGAAYAGTVYAVMEQTHTKDGMPVKKERFIMLALLQYRREDRGWNYKTLEECEGPYKHDCPQKYFDMVPCPDEPYAKAYRQRCQWNREFKAKWKFYNEEYKQGKLTYEVAQTAVSMERKAFDAKVAALQETMDLEVALRAAKQKEEHDAKLAAEVKQAQEACQQANPQEA